VQEMIELYIDETKAVAGGAEAMPPPTGLPPVVVKAIDFIESLFRPHLKQAAK
jgi:hypothetical protein